MSTQHKKIFLSAVGAVILCWIAAPLLRVRVQNPPLAEAPLHFDPQRAFRFTEELVTRFPRRVLGSLEARQSTGYIRQSLESLGYTISYSHFEAIIGGRNQVGRNIYAFKAGQAPEILAVLAHYDTARTTFQGAADDGSGVGILLELARIFADIPTRHGLLFVATDGEEWGMLGAADMAASFPQHELIMAAISLDYVAPGELASLDLEGVGQGRGFTPPWLRRVARIAAEAEGLPTHEPSGVQEHLQRAFLLSWTDQGPLLSAAIPAVNIGSKSRDAVMERTIYHSEQDSIEKLQSASFNKIGRLAERMLRTLDGLRDIPKESMQAFRIAGQTWLPGIVIATLHCLTFLPLFLIACFQLSNYRASLSPDQILREMVAYLGTFFPFLLLYGSIALVGRLRLLPLFSRYPAPPKDPILTSPKMGVLISLSAVFLAAGVGCYFLAKVLCRKLPRSSFGASKPILLLLLCILCILGLIYNSYWTVAFLSLPAWVWALLGAGRSAAARFFHRIVIIAAGIPYFLVLIFYARALQVGWDIFWYQLLALNCGMFQVKAFLLASVAMTLGVRFLVIQSHPEGA